MKSSTFINFFTICLYILFILSCRPEQQFDNNPNLQLVTSLDTVLFDTLFTTINSITKSFKIYNPTSKYLKIEAVEIAGRLASNFRINVNGRSGVYITDVIIRPKDSIWVFVQARIDPTNHNTPYLVTDSILLHLKNKTQKIILIAYGQDAYFHIPTHPATSNFPAYSTISGILPNDKPHVFYGLVIIPKDSILIIPAGTKLYMHHNANLVAAYGASLKIFGTKGNEVIIQSDRLDSYYRDLPGNWGRIWLSAGSKDHYIEYAIIKNGKIGIHVDSIGSFNLPTLILKNTIVKNMSAAAMFAQGSWVEAQNCIFANAGEILVWLNIGGKYDFRHCTFANFWQYSTRQLPSVIINNYYKDIFGNYHVRPIENAFFGNCIVWGQLEDELAFDKYPFSSSIYNVNVDHCIVRLSKNLSQYPVTFNQVIRNINPLFEKPDSFNFKLSNGSPAIDVGSHNNCVGISTDIEGKPRIIGVAPDMGAYEKQ